MGIAGTYYEIFEQSEKPGQVTYSFLKKVWKEYTDEEKELFIRFMLTAELCFQTKAGSELKNQIFVVPQMLGAKPAGLDYNTSYGLSEYKEVCYTFLPAIFIQQFIVRARNLAAVEDMWNVGVFLSHKGDYALVEASYSDKKITIYYSPSAEDLYQAIEEELDDIAESGNVRLQRGSAFGFQKYFSHSEQKSEKIKSHKTMRNDIFISYSHHEEDQPYFDEIQRQLKTLKTYGLDVHVWDDTQIRTGDVWFDEITKGLEKTKVAILLVSQNFLGSKFINETEIPAFLDMLQKDGGKLMPILLRKVPFQRHPILKNYQFLNANLPLNRADEGEKDDFYAKLVDDILEFYEQNPDPMPSTKPQTAENNITSATAAEEVSLSEMLVEERYGDLFNYLEPKVAGDSSLQNDLVQLQARYNRLQRQLSQGVISSADAEMRFNQINQATQYLLSRLP